MKKKAPDFEEQMQRLTTIVNQLESMDLPLEESVALYKEGRKLSVACKQQLEVARNEVMLCTQEGMTEFIPISEENISDKKDQ